MEKCSELVLRLHGSEATEGMFDLVFGRNPGDCSHSVTASSVGHTIPMIFTGPTTLYLQAQINIPSTFSAGIPY